MLELDSSIGTGKFPVDSGLCFVSSVLPSRYFIMDQVVIVDSAVHALIDEHVEFDLGHTVTESAGSVSRRRFRDRTVGE